MSQPTITVSKFVGTIGLGLLTVSALSSTPQSHTSQSSPSLLFKLDLLGDKYADLAS